VPWIAVRSGIGIVLLSLWLSVSQDVPLVDCLLAPVCPIEKVTLWSGLLFLTRGFEAQLSAVIRW